jgi:hypothetical protein
MSLTDVHDRGRAAIVILAVVAIATMLPGHSGATIPSTAQVEHQRVFTSPRDCADMNVAGRWSGTGVDEGGTRWDRTMELTQTRCDVEGVITWRASSGRAGRELVRGRLDSTTRRFDFNGQQMEAGRGAIILGIYHAEFSADLRRITGRWTNGVPGTFEGTRQ